MAPEGPVIDPSSLTKFRKLRLKDINLLDMLIGKTVTLALEKEILKSNSIIVDATHSKVRNNEKSPGDIERARKLQRPFTPWMSRSTFVCRPKTRATSLRKKFHIVRNSLPSSRKSRESR
ncbi:hypothetical protein D3C75_1150780 [compost metagenome]